jgi:hypothetical protein
MRLGLSTKTLKQQQACLKGNADKLENFQLEQEVCIGSNMSQKEVYELLEELGGKATTTKVSELAKKKYPKYTVYTYVSARLKSLKK